MVKANQQIRTQPDQLPTDKHHDGIVRQNQKKHASHKKIEVAKKLSVSRVVSHVTSRVDVNERSDEGDETYHHGAKPVEHKRDFYLKLADVYPREERVVNRGAAIEELVKRHKRDDRANGGRADAEDGVKGVVFLVRVAKIEKSHKERREKRQNYYNTKHVSSLRQVCRIYRCQWFVWLCKDE